MYNEEKLYSVRTLVVVHILNFQRDLVAMRFIRIELIICSTSKHNSDDASIDQLTLLFYIVAKHISTLKGHHQANIQ